MAILLNLIRQSKSLGYNSEAFDCDSFDERGICDLRIFYHSRFHTLCAITKTITSKHRSDR